MCSFCWTSNYFTVVFSNCRIKSFEFEEKGFTFELPKILTLSDCSFRVLFTQYDHYSHHCKSYYPRKKAKVEGR